MRKLTLVLLLTCCWLMATAGQAQTISGAGKCAFEIAGPEIVVIGESGAYKVVRADGSRPRTSDIRWSVSTMAEDKKVYLTGAKGPNTRLMVDGPPALADLDTVLLFAEVHAAGCEPARPFRGIRLDRERARIPWLEGYVTWVGGASDILPQAGDKVEITPSFHLPPGWVVDFVSLQPDSFVMPDQHRVTVPVYLQAELSGPKGQRMTLSEDIQVHQARQTVQDIQTDLDNLELRILMLELRLWALEFALEGLEGTANEMETEFADFMDQVMEWLGDTPQFDDTATGMVGWANNFDGDMEVGSLPPVGTDYDNARVRIHKDFHDHAGMTVTRKKDDMGGTQDNTITLKLVLVHELRHVWQFCQNRAADEAGEPRPYPDTDSLECDAQIWESKWGVPWEEPEVDDVTPGPTTPGGSGGPVTPGGGTTRTGTVTAVVTRAGVPVEGATVLFTAKSGNFELVGDDTLPSVVSADGTLGVTTTDAEGLATVQFLPTGKGSGTVEAVARGGEGLRTAFRFRLREANARPVNDLAKPAAR